MREGDNEVEMKDLRMFCCVVLIFDKRESGV